MSDQSVKCEASCFVSVAQSLSSARYQIGSAIQQIRKLPGGEVSDMAKELSGLADGLDSVVEKRMNPSLRLED